MISQLIKTIRWWGAVPSTIILTCIFTMIVLTFVQFYLIAKEAF